MRIFKEHPQWNQVLEVCTQLSKSGYRAYLAGGCVRDAIIGTPPVDFDVATDASPDEVQKLFTHSIDVGKNFGVIIVPFDGFQVEIASFRSDGIYTDGRRPSSVRFSSPEEDAKRRDFTVNALFYDWVDDRVIDYVGGVGDIDRRIIRCVGDPESRFKEDHLRMVRAVRFHAQLDFEIENQTLTAIKKLAPLTADISKERIREELLKLLKCKKRASGIQLLSETKILESILPPLAAFQNEVGFSRTLKALSQNFQLTQEVNRWAVLLIYYQHEGAGSTREFLKEIKCSNFVVSYVSQLIEAYWKSLNRSCPAHVLKRLVAQYNLDLLELHRIQGEVDLNLSRWNELSQLPTELPLPFVTSADLKDAGVEEGPRFGELLDQFFDRQLDGEFLSREDALSELTKLKP